MKLKDSLIITALIVAGTTLLSAAPDLDNLQGAKLRPTHEALMKRKAEALKKQNEAREKRGLKPVEPGSIKYRAPKKMGTLMDRSTILCSGGNWTLVPKEAVLHVPPAYKARVDGTRSGKLIPWKDFLLKNRGWVHTHSVSMAQARGDVKIPNEQTDTYKRLGRVVVAVCHNGPISVKPPKVAEDVALVPKAK